MRRVLQQGGHNPSALDFLADVANSAGNYPGGSSKGTAAAAAASAGTAPINGILKVTHWQMKLLPRRI